VSAAGLRRARLGCARCGAADPGEQRCQFPPLFPLGRRRTQSDRDGRAEARNRSELGLPGAQLELAKRVLAAVDKTGGAGKPVVVVLMNGRPLAIPWLAEHAPAILEAWYLGVRMGPAVADVLFGDVSPSGKLPVTFPRAVGQVPIYYNHKNTGRRYDLWGRASSCMLDIATDGKFPWRSA
jgi:beta-glucosidase